MTAPTHTCVFCSASWPCPNAGARPCPTAHHTGRGRPRNPARVRFVCTPCAKANPKGLGVKDLVQGP